MNAPAELKVDRTRFLGGSDCAAILGLSPWATPLDVYFEKIGDSRARKVDAAKEKIFKRGKRLEPIVIDMLIEEYGIKVTKRSAPDAPNRYQDPEYDFLSAEIDFEWEVTEEVAARHDLDPALIGTIQNGEIKTVHPFAAAKFGEEDTDEMPVEYFAQAMHGLMVTGRRLTLFGVLVGADDLSVYWTKREDETIAGMRAREVDFWTNNVLAKLPPDPVNLPDVLHLFGRAGETTIEATEEVLQWHRDFAEAKEFEKATNERIEDLKFRIGKFMLGDALDDDAKPTPGAKPGRHVLRAAGRELLTVRFQEQNRVDSDSLRKLYPDVAAECSKRSQFFVYALPRSKK